MDLVALGGGRGVGGAHATVSRPGMATAPLRPGHACVADAAERRGDGGALSQARRRHLPVRGAGHDVAQKKPGWRRGFSASSRVLMIPPIAQRPPQSATNFALSVVALIAGLAMLWVIAPWQNPGLVRFVPYAPMIPCLAIVMVIATSEWFWPALCVPSSTASARAPLRPLNLRRVGVRFCGIIATLALVAFAYWLFPEYGGDFYRPYWQFLRTIAPLGVAVPFYLVWLD